MLSRDELFNKLLHLVPNAKFVFWPDEEGVNDKGYGTVVKMGGYCVAWYPENPAPLPSLKDIQDLDVNVVNAKLELNRKAIRDKERAGDLAVIAGYEMEKKSNPTLDFTVYLDSLEVKSKEMQDKIEKKV